MKTSLWENRGLGAASIVLAAALALFAIGPVKTKGVAKPVQTYYAAEMAADFSAREQAAQSIISLAANEDVPKSLLDDAAQALTLSQTATVPAERYQAGAALKTNVELIYNSLPAEMRDNKGSPAQMAWAEFTGRTAILSHTIPEYNERAADAKSKLSGFPGALMAQIAGVSVEEMA